MLKLILLLATVMLDVANLNRCVLTKQTGWKFEVKKGELRVCKSNETHSWHANRYNVFNKGALHLKLETF
jgi:hypothetical protein